MTKKVRLIFAILTAFALCLAAFVAFAPQGGTADADGFTWSVRVTKYVNDSYQDLGVESTLSDASSVTILIKNDGNASDDFSFLASDENLTENKPNDLTISEHLANLEISNSLPSGWTDISSNTLDIGGVAYRYSNQQFSGKEQRYFYFRRKYTIEQNGQIATAYEYYSRCWHIVANPELTEADLEITNIVAKYKKNGEDEEYGGEWIGTDLTFTITTKYMTTKHGGTFDPGSEKLRYSIDQKAVDDVSKSWIPMTGNVAKFHNSLKEAKVDFELTDIERNYVKHTTYERDVNIDAEEPIFTVSAMTRNAANEEQTYSNGEWSCSDILFSLTDRSACISGVEYSVSTDGANYTRMETSNYRVGATTRGLKFRATNSAGVIYNYNGDFNALIDPVRPGVNVDGFTTDPKDDSKTIAIVDGYANGDVVIDVYNRDTLALAIDNKSGVRCYYKTKINDGEYSAESEATLTSTNNAGETFYVINGAIGKHDVLEKREYLFYLVSGAGLKSNEVTYTVTLVNSFFEIEVEEITYSANASGWSAAPIDVYVTVPSDSKIIRDYDGNIQSYSVPTAKYKFVYAPVNISGVSYTVDSTYYRYVDGEEGKSVYTFKLDASAESVFTVYGINAAGKRSDNTYTSLNVIKIDTQPPEVELTAYVKDGDVSGDKPDDPIYITSGTWVNGRVNMTLSVKDGVSGVLVRDLNFAMDGAGNPVYDANGNMVWQESSSIHAWDSQTNHSDGSKYFGYNIVVGVPSSEVTLFSREYRFRVYTGSGVSRDVSFLVNIDLNTIILDSLSYEFGDVGGDVNVRDNVITTDSVCADGVITLYSNEPQRGHFDYYLYDETAETFVKVEGNEIPVEIPTDRRGTIEKKLYLVSRAIDYLGAKYTTDIANPYVISIPYNTLSISIERSIVRGSGTETEDEWVDTDVSVQVKLLANDQGVATELSAVDRNKYSYYYMLVPASGSSDLNAAIRNGTWIKATNGEYDANNVFVFRISFVNTSFYGYLALSVTNEAGFRSADGGDMATLLRIDQTTPSVTDMIVVLSGTNEDNLTNEYHTITYNTKDELTLRPKRYEDRSDIYYFYAILDSETGEIPIMGGNKTITGNPTRDGEGNWTLNGWVLLSSDVTLTAPDGLAKYHYLLYAVNEMGKHSGGLDGENISTKYEFVIDSSTMSGNLSYRQEDGGYFDASLNMYTYLWEKQATITLYVTGSNTRVMYWYSLDDGQTWDAYHETDGNAIYYDVGEANAHALRFDENYFPEGINGAFTFKAVNKAGTEYIYDQKIYIAIDTMVPDFEILTAVDGVDYHSERLSLVLTDKSAAEWSSRPVTITINMLKTNKSGVRLTYTLEYLFNNTATSTEERELPSYTSFTTDRLDGFGKNRDAIITIYATSRADGTKRTAHQVRVKVDQVTPVFTLTGHAADDDSTEPKLITSGQWTNRRRVTISKASDENYVNVSGVTYRYQYSDLESTGVVENVWPDSNPYFEKICTIVVTATTEAGLTYTQRFDVNIDTIPPVIKFMSNITVVEYEKHYIDLKVYVEEENIDICEYITTRGDTRGFALDPTGYVISTSSVDNTVKNDPADNNSEYRGYVKVYVKDYAGNEATFEFYMLPFALDVNNVTLSAADRRTVDKYEEDLNEAESYMEASRVVYFRNLISRLRDRIHTLENEIETYRAYLERLAQRTSFELRSDYAEMYSYLETYNNYKLYGQGWIQDAIKGEGGSKYYNYFQNLENAFKTLQGQMENVTAVENETKLLPAINMVTAEEYTKVLNVYAHYLDLTSDQKACFNSNLYTKLLDLKKKCEVMLLADQKTGISLDAEFAPGSRIQVESFAVESEYFTNAQTALMNTVAENEARAILSIYRISLRGEASQTSTGEVTVKMPIPKDYQQYIRFAVYKMGVDGTITRVQDMEIEGDGKSVTFVADELSTFVLAAKANIQQTAADSDTYGTFLGLPLDVTMIRTFLIIGAVILGLLIVIVLIAGLRHRRFLNTYNRAYKSGIYRRGIQQIPKGNTVPRQNPIAPGTRLRDQQRPY